MKNKILISIMVFFSILAFGQKIKKENIIKLDSTWSEEIFPFPINFASNINYTGIAEVRFPPKGWINPEHTFFWSYTYAWSINFDKKMTAKKLESDLINYFDGLNNVTEMNNLEQKASAKINKIKSENSTTFFEGKINTFDHFATNKRFVLNVKIESHFCKKTQKTVLHFTFSPKEYTHEVWETLDEIELVNGVCKI